MAMAKGRQARVRRRRVLGICAIIAMSSRLRPDRMGKAKNTAVRPVVMRCLRGALFVQQGRFLCLALSQTSG